MELSSPGADVEFLLRSRSRGWCQTVSLRGLVRVETSLV